MPKKKTKNPSAVSLGAIGGASGTGDAKRRAPEHYSEAGKKGIKTMLKKTASRRSEICRNAAKARWANRTDK